MLGLTRMEVACWGVVMTIIDAAFVLTDHGKVLRTISEAEYWRLARAQVTFVSGFVLSFAYWAAAGYTFAREPIDE